LYPIVYLDCIHVKVRDNGAVRVKAVYLALGIKLDGEKELLGCWRRKKCDHLYRLNSDQAIDCVAYYAAVDKSTRL